MRLDGTTPKAQAYNGDQANFASYRPNPQIDHKWMASHEDRHLENGLFDIKGLGFDQVPPSLQKAILEKAKVEPLTVAEHARQFQRLLAQAV